jgi:uracil-DNA glycosylase
VKEADIEQSWYSFLKKEFTKDYFKELKKIVINEYQNKCIYPPHSLIYNAFNLTKIEEIKVVILGQDPYHGQGQANGLCFSVPNNQEIPPSLRNIFKELKEDLSIQPPRNGSLNHWANEGVLLLNSILTVESGKANSHKGIGWETFTESVIKLISLKMDNIVFLLWGKYAQNKEPLIDCKKHLILKASHPSPLSSYRSFFGCKHFSKTNSYLINNGKQKIKW